MVLSPLEIVRLINAEDAKVAAAVADEADAIAQAIEAIADRLGRGGRLIYVGAGTSGRLGVLDAVECPPTFNTNPGQVVGVIAGGYTALTRSVEGAEDLPALAIDDLKNLQVGPTDVRRRHRHQRPHALRHRRARIRPQRRRLHHRPELQPRPASWPPAPT